jgi:hypothetical protein
MLCAAAPPPPTTTTTTHTHTHRRINQRVLQVVNQLEDKLPQSRWGDVGVPPLHAAPLPRAVTAWRYREHGADGQGAQWEDMGCTPYLRLVRSGLRDGQWALTSGPLLRPELEQHRAATARARQQAANHMTLVAEHQLRLGVARQLADNSSSNSSSNSNSRFWMPHFVDFR